LLGDELRGKIGEVAETQAHFSTPHKIADLEAVRSTQLKARIPMSGRETPQLFY
jgi:hypothetical protein